MMLRFNGTIGAAVLVGLGIIYAVIALVVGHSARAESLPDLRATEAGVDVWQAIKLMADGDQPLRIVDVRTAEHFELFHLPQSRNLPDASASALLGEAGSSTLLLVATTDAKAAALIGQLSGAAKGKNHFLKGGAQAWYLALEIPAPLFSSKPPPYGYQPAMGTVRSWIQDPQSVSTTELDEAVAKLATLGFVPDGLAGKRKPKSSGKKKKIAGGCG